jgi:hypothetical protein
MGRNVSCTVSVTKVIAPSNMGFRYGKREYPLDLPSLRLECSVLFECKVEEEHEVLHKLNSAAS